MREPDEFHHALDDRRAAAAVPERVGDPVVAGIEHLGELRAEARVGCMPAARVQHVERDEQLDHRGGAELPAGLWVAHSRSVAALRSYGGASV